MHLFMERFVTLIVPTLCYTGSGNVALIQPTMIISVVAIIWVFITFNMYDKIMLSGTQYHEVSSDSQDTLAKRVYNVVEEMKEALNTIGLYENLNEADLSTILGLSTFFTKVLG